VAAQVLERRWRKDQILEAYLNLVPFRGELVGIDALSRTLFGKAAQGWTARGGHRRGPGARPNAPEAQVARAPAVLGAVQAQPLKPGKPDCEALDLLVAGPAAPRPGGQQRRGPALGAPAAGRLPEGGRAGQRAQHLRAPLQRFAVQTLQRHLRELRGRNVEDGALVVLDNASGEVLAWVGSSGALSQAARSMACWRAPARLHAQAFLYAQAIAERRLTAASLLDDSPAQIPTPAACTSRRTTTAVQGLGVGAHGAGRVAQRAGGAHAGHGHARCLHRQLRAGPAAARKRRLLRLQPGAGQREVPLLA
jgi:penicillin-binding protein 1C